MLKYGQMRLTVETVTPAIAKMWLQSNVGNRRLRDSAVDQYTFDMVNGYWERKPVAICFDDDGHLVNGQHTLNAIVRSGQAQELLVARGVPRRAVALMDRGLIRTLNDVATFLDAKVESRQASIARVVQWGPRAKGSKSFDELFAAYQAHADVVDFVCGAGARGVAGLNAMSLAVCAKAAYSRDRAKISRFIEVVRTGLSNGAHESAAIRLRDFCRGDSAAKAHNGQSLREQTYFRTMAALDHFLRDKPISKLYGTEVDFFPITVPANAA